MFSHKVLCRVLLCVAAVLKHLFGNEEFEYTHDLKNMNGYWEDRTLIEWIRERAKEPLDPARFPLPVPERCSRRSVCEESADEAVQFAARSWNLSLWRGTMTRLGKQPHRDHQHRLLRRTVVCDGFSLALRHHLNSVFHPRQQLTNEWQRAFSVEHVETDAELVKVAAQPASVLLAVVHTVEEHSLHLVSDRSACNISDALDRLCDPHFPPQLLGVVCCGLSKQQLKLLAQWARRTSCHVVVAAKPGLQLGQLAEPAPQEMAQLTEAVACQLGDLPASTMLATEMVVQLASTMMPQLTHADNQFPVLLYTPEGDCICLSKASSRHASVAQHPQKRPRNDGNDSDDSAASNSERPLSKKQALALLVQGGEGAVLPAAAASSSVVTVPSVPSVPSVPIRRRHSGGQQPKPLERLLQAHPITILRELPPGVPADFAEKVARVFRSKPFYVQAQWAPTAVATGSDRVGACTLVFTYRGLVNKEEDVKAWKNRTNRHLRENIRGHICVPPLDAPKPLSLNQADVTALFQSLQVEETNYKAYDLKDLLTAARLCCA